MTKDAEKHEGPRIGSDKVRLFEKTEAQLEGFFEEIGNISKKKPDDAINKFKLGYVNQMLETANTLLGTDYRPFPDFERFDLDTLPSASDVVTMLSQYLRSMDTCRKDHTTLSGGWYYWNLPGQSDHSLNSERIRAKRPKNFNY